MDRCPDKVFEKWWGKGMKTSDLFAKLFVTGRYFTIALRRCQDESVLKNRIFTPQYLMPANGQEWFADPMLVDAEGKTWLFYEAVLGDKGHIEVAQVFDDCTLGTPAVVLKDDCHYSYPFVFQHENTWYMIPESSASSEVRLYRATSFPEKWEKCAVLLRERAVDSTVFEQNGQLYLLTYCPMPDSERVVPQAYKLELGEDKAELMPLQWQDYDTLRVRGAGPVFLESGEQYRPAQISREQRYGDGLVFYRICDPSEYKEEAICEMKSECLRIHGVYADGLHTYCRTDRFEAIDIRCGTVDYSKPFRKLF